VVEYLALHLEQVRSKIRYLGDPLGTDLGQLLDIGRRDIYLLMDVTRYQRSILEVAQTVRKHGVTIILVTDEQLSPVANLADVVLPASVESPSPFYSLTAAFMLVELLVVPVLERLGESAHTRMTIWEDGRAHELLDS
jgi:DNA-binding MurR/RpiR family transcriptional regulator